jgi:CDP-4-dehydro-6-deoxyglucose reductase
LGSFYLREDTDKPIVFVASGTGFAPIKSMVEYARERHIRRPMKLYWGCRTPADLYMDEVARGWAATLPNFEYIPVISDAAREDPWSGRTGFVHRAVIEDLPDLSSHQVYACGAPPMVDAARSDFIRHCGLPEGEFLADVFLTEAELASAPASIELITS